jgi:hypothetical protein
MEISPGRDLILSLAGKRIRGEAFTAREENLIEVFASLPGFNNPIQVACPRCRGNVIVMMSEAEIPPTGTFERQSDNAWRCLSCASDARAQVVAVH